MDPTTVLGLFNYGARAGIGVDAENEIDIEFSRWNNTCHGCNADFTFYPSTGNKALGPMEDNFIYDPHGSTLTTARFEWSSTRIAATVMGGLQPLGTTANVLQTLAFYSGRLRRADSPSPLALGYEPLVLQIHSHHRPRKSSFAISNLSRNRQLRLPVRPHLDDCPNSLSFFIFAGALHADEGACGSWGSRVSSVGSGIRHGAGLGVAVGSTSFGVPMRCLSSTTNSAFPVARFPYHNSSSGCCFTVESFAYAGQSRSLRQRVRAL